MKNPKIYPPRTVGDVNVIDLIAALYEALEWCGGSPDFAPGGQARAGWQRAVKPLMRLREMHRHDALTLAQLRLLLPTLEVPRRRRSTGRTN
ncbi:MAG TPA: hypothetical protein VN646_16920 [Candidatus Acidoferrum sp.]|nr:hypothetical protein [Candidatus Acidoferrum sp.]